jgi:putative glutamine amidotransferase
MKHISPLIGVPCCRRDINEQPFHAVAEKYATAITVVVGGVPLLIPPLGEKIDLDDLIERFDGFLVTGSPSNVEPHHYDGEPSVPGTKHDAARDATTLPLIRLALARDVPILAICRGIQELNVALGGTLATEIQEREGSLDHRGPVSDNQDHRFAIRQKVSIKPGSCLAGVFGPGEIMVNSVHRQAVDRLGPRLQVEAVADDGTVEAVSVKDAPAFAVGVQWHPEYWVKSDGNSARIFHAFGEAARAYALAKTGMRTAAE